jgi:hypothetical protein
VYINRAGQMQITIPVREIWLYHSRVSLAKVNEGLSEAAKGELLHDLGSFAKFADDDIE